MNTLLPVEEAQALIKSSLKCLSPESIDLSEINSHILAEDVKADSDMPPFDRSSVDGYALGSDDTTTPFIVLGEIQPGTDPSLILKEGEAARIFTGAKIPQGATKVAMQEVCSCEKGRIIISENDPNTCIRKQGEDIKEGEIVAHAGLTLEAGECSILASVGCINPLVYRKPKIMHISTGNEIVSPNKKPATGEIRDSNSILIKQLIEQYGGTLSGKLHCKDNKGFLTNQIEKFLEGSQDILLVSGGASVGKYDFGAEVLTNLGFDVKFQKLNSRPGKPLTFAVKGTKCAFIIPGNPLAHFVSFHIFIRLAIASMQNKSHGVETVTAMMTDDFKYKENPRKTFCPATLRWSNEHNSFEATQLSWNSSGDLRGMIECNAFLVREKGQSGIEKGSSADFLLLN